MKCRAVRMVFTFTATVAAACGGSDGSPSPPAAQDCRLAAVFEYCDGIAMVDTAGNDCDQQGEIDVSFTSKDGGALGTGSAECKAAGVCTVLCVPPECNCGVELMPTAIRCTVCETSEPFMAQFSLPTTNAEVSEDTPVEGLVSRLPSKSEGILYLILALADDPNNTWWPHTRDVATDVETLQFNGSVYVGGPGTFEIRLIRIPEEQAAGFDRALLDYDLRARQEQNDFIPWGNRGEPPLSAFQAVTEATVRVVRE